MPDAGEARAHVEVTRSDVVLMYGFPYMIWKEVFEVAAWPFSVGMFTQAMSCPVVLSYFSISCAKVHAVSAPPQTVELVPRKMMS